MSSVERPNGAQDDFWSGPFGDGYTDRNSDPRLIAANIWMFSQALRSCGEIGSVLEFGANVGLNLQALRALYPEITCDAVEINRQAAGHLRQNLGVDHVFEQSLVGFDPKGRKWDLVLCKGVLIHLSPDVLADVFRMLRNATSKFILLAEYYSPSAAEVNYRGHSDRLFKRDFAGDLLAQHPEVVLRDYGFAYRRDPLARQDDLNWFLLEVPGS